MTLNRQARLGIDQALELLDDSDMEGDLSNSENEDGDNSYLPDEFEIAQREADNEPSLNDSDMQQAQIASGTEVQNDTDNFATASQDNEQTDNHRPITVVQRMFLSLLPRVLLTPLRQPQPLLHSRLLHLLHSSHLDHTITFLVLQVLRNFSF